MPVKYNTNWNPIKAGGWIDKGLLSLTVDVQNRSKALAPVLNRNLVNSSTLTPITGGYQIKYGSGKVPYARRRHFENKKNPQTLGYLAVAGDSVARGDTGKYFRGKI